jgi:hypothetical protein
MNKGDKKMASIAIVGGTWDKLGGKPSKIVEDLAKGVRLSDKFRPVVVNNGGYYGSLSRGVASGCYVPADVVIWMPNIPNNLPKLPNIKAAHPKTILVSSKNNIPVEYSFQDIMAHGLALKSNLILEIRKLNNLFTGRLFDTLGNVWRGTTIHFKEIGLVIASRSRDLMGIKRQGTVQSPEKEDPIVPLCPAASTLEFLNIVTDTADTFHRLIQPAKGITRFLGNASFRCERGFPSLRFKDGRIYMSKRNVDKRHIELNAFVQVGINDGTGVVWYRGTHKPSVDTVVQVRLYRALSNIHYMIHSHVYEKNAPFTSRMIPCGGLEEIQEVLDVISNNDLRGRPHFAVNLKGHGSIVFMSDPRDFNQFKFKARPTPETM